MKTKIKRHSRSVLSVVLALSMLISCMMVGIIATDAAYDDSDDIGYGVQDSKVVYFVNLPAWTNVYMHFWGSWGHNHPQMTRLQNTGVYYFQNSGDYTADGFNFMNSNSATDGGSKAFYDWVTSDKAYYSTGNNDGNAFDDMQRLNSTAKVVMMVDSVGLGTYTKQANAVCSATVSSKNISGLAVNDTSGSTGAAASEAECYPAYGATVNYSATVSNATYVFDGFSTTNSSSLPAGATQTKSVTSTGYNNGGAPATVYAYFHTTITPYFVTGTTALVGSSAAWDNDADEGFMTLASGTTYTKKFSNVSAGTHKFRISDGEDCVTDENNVTISGNAGAALGSDEDYQNIVFTTDAEKDVTITFNSTPSNSKYLVTVNLTDPPVWVKTNASIADVAPKTYVDATNNYLVMDANSTLNGAEKNITLKHTSGGTSFYWAEITPDNSDLWDGQRWIFWSSNTSSSGIQGSSTSSVSKINGTTASDTAVEFKNAQNEYLFKVQKNSSTDKRALLVHRVSDKVSKIGVRVSNSSGIVNYEFYYQLAETPEEDPGVVVDTVDIYAKDGSLRDGYQLFSEYAETRIDSIMKADGTTHDTAAEATIKRYNYQNTGTNASQSDSEHTGATRYDYAKATGVEVGSIITITTRLYRTSQWNNTDWYGSNFNDTHYVKAFSINGEAPEIYTWKAEKASSTYTEYTMTHTITEEDLAKDRSNNNYIEITPIIYLKDETYTKTFYIEGYDRNDEKYTSLGWGTTLGIYPYYQEKYDSENAFGGYPGQPMLFYHGRYEIQIPLTHDGTSKGAKCLGITMSNNYWDILHRSLDKDIVNNDEGHRQTYDFDDFYEIKEEKNPDQIIFSFKLRESESETKINNFGDGYDRNNFSYADDSEKTLYRNTTTNVLYKKNKTTVFSDLGIEAYKDGLNRDVNLFGTPLSAVDAAKPKLLVVSNGYKYTYVGKYATEWVVYKNAGTEDGMTKYTYVTQIAPSALVLNSLSSFSSYTYAGGSTTTAATGPKPLGNYQAAYTTLSGSDYTDKAFDICYESHQYISSDDKADRLDGRWLYTKNGDKISAQIKIQYQDSSHVTWTEDAFTTGYDSKSNQGTTTGAQAYFTNITPVDLDGQTTATGIPIVPGNYFTFKTVPASDDAHMNYVFQGWYVSLNGSDPIELSKVASLESKLEMTGNAVIIARYKELKSGILTIRHNVSTGTINSTVYAGTGTPYLKVELLNGSNEVKDTFAETANGQYNTTKYMTTAYASNNYKFRITLKAVAANEDNVYGTTTETGSLDTLNIAGATGTVNGVSGRVFTVPISSFFTAGVQTVTSLVYTTYFTLTEYTYKYVINYKFPTRLYGEEIYKVEKDDIPGNKMAAYFDGDKGSAKLKQSVISGNTPFESNFKKTLTWGYAAAYDGTLDAADDYTKPGQHNSGNVSNKFTISVTVTAREDSNNGVNAFFMLPYQYDSVTKQAVSYQVYNGPDTYYTENDRGTGENKYELFDGSGNPEYNSLTDAQLKAQTGADRKYLMYNESAAADSPRKVYDNLTAKTTASTSTQNGESSIVGYDNSVVGFNLEAGMGQLFTYDGVNNLGRDSHFVAAPQYIYVANGSTASVDTWNHKQYGNVTYHTIRETTTFRTHDVTTNAQYVSYKNTKNGIIAGEYTKKYFTRWDIYSQSDNRYLTSCYYDKFNYTCYEDVFVVPVFESSTPGAFVEEAEVKNNLATVSFLENTRNQWNVMVDDRAPNAVADKIYSDFALSYGDGSTILNELTADDSKKVRVGMLIERLDGLTGADITSTSQDADSSVITSASSYVKEFNPKVYEALLLNDNGDDDTGAAESDTYKKSTYSSLAGNTVNCKIASNTDWSGCSNTLAALDNKNRIEYYYGLNKLLGSTSYKTYKYAYRAISYILVKNGDNWTAVVSDPAYFTIYDTATQTVAN